MNTTPTTTALGPRLAAVDLTGYCDTKHEHEARIITDGNTVYAYGTGPAGVDYSGGWRTGTEVSVSCAQPDRDDEPCGGTVTVRLDEPGAWTSSADALALLARYGQQVDQ